MTTNEMVITLGALTEKQKDAVKSIILEAMNMQRIACVCGNAWAVQAVKEIKEICKQ